MKTWSLYFRDLPFIPHPSALIPKRSPRRSCNVRAAGRIFWPLRAGRYGVLFMTTVAKVGPEGFGTSSLSSSVTSRPKSFSAVSV